MACIVCPNSRDSVKERFSPLCQTAKAKPAKGWFASWGESIAFRLHLDYFLYLFVHLIKLQYLANYLVVVTFTLRQLSLANGSRSSPIYAALTVNSEPGGLQPEIFEGLARGWGDFGAPHGNGKVSQRQCLIQDLRRSGKDTSSNGRHSV